MKPKFVLAVLLIALTTSPARAASTRVTLMRVWNNGIQPQAAVDSKGLVHLIYFEGDPAGGDLFYIQLPRPGQIDPLTPLKVNSRPGSALAIGTIRGAQMAVGRKGRVHVAWNGPAPRNGG